MHHRRIAHAESAGAFKDIVLRTRAETTKRFQYDEQREFAEMPDHFVVDPLRETSNIQQVDGHWQDEFIDSMGEMQNTIRRVHEGLEIGHLGMPSSDMGPSEETKELERRDGLGRACIMYGLGRFGISGGVAEAVVTHGADFEKWLDDTLTPWLTPGTNRIHRCILRGLTFALDGIGKSKNRLKDKYMHSRKAVLEYLHQVIAELEIRDDLPIVNRQLLGRSRAFLESPTSDEVVDRIVAAVLARAFPLVHFLCKPNETPRSVSTALLNDCVPGFRVHGQVLSDGIRRAQLNALHTDEPTTLEEASMYASRMLLAGQHPLLSILLAALPNPQI